MLLFNSVVGMMIDDEIIPFRNIGVVVVIPLCRVAAVFAASLLTIQPIIVPVPEQLNKYRPSDLLKVVWFATGAMIVSQEHTSVVKK